MLSYLAAVPMGVTGLLPIIWLPLMGIMSGSAVASTYFGDSVIICWSSFLISEAVEKYNLHKRLAYNVLMFSYRDSATNNEADSTHRRKWVTSDELLLLSFIFVTGFISMWLSNSASAALMIPLAKAVMVGLRTPLSDPSSSVDPVSSHAANEPLSYLLIVGLYEYNVGQRKVIESPAILGHCHRLEHSVCCLFRGHGYADRHGGQFGAARNTTVSVRAQLRWHHQLCGLVVHRWSALSAAVAHIMACASALLYAIRGFGRSNIDPAVKLSLFYHKQ